MFFMKVKLRAWKVGNFGSITVCFFFEIMIRLNFIIKGCISIAKQGEFWVSNNIFENWYFIIINFEKNLIGRLNFPWLFELIHITPWFIHRLWNRINRINLNFSLLRPSTKLPYKISKSALNMYVDWDVKIYWIPHYKIL